MSVRERPTAQQAELIDIDERPPFPGQRVLALTEGNKLVELVWSESWRGHIFAWSPYLKVPQAVKDKLNAHYFRKADMAHTLS